MANTEGRDVEIRVVRMPSIVALAMEVAPLVRRGIITDAEGRQLVDRNYRDALARLYDGSSECGAGFSGFANCTRPRGHEGKHGFG